jgi:hypothetical protein
MAMVPGSMVLGSQRRADRQPAELIAAAQRRARRNSTANPSSIRGTETDTDAPRVTAQEWLDAHRAADDRHRQIAETGSGAGPERRQAQRSVARIASVQPGRSSGWAGCG